MQQDSDALALTRTCMNGLWVGLVLSIVAIVFGAIAIRYPSVTGIALVVGGVLGLVGCALLLARRGRGSRDARLE